MHYKTFGFFFIVATIYADRDSRLQFFKMVDEINCTEVSTDLLALQSVARNTLSFIQNHEYKEWFSPVKSGLLEQKNITFKDVKKTLSYIVKVIEQDKNKSKQRMLDSDFLRTHFTFIQWLPDLETAHKRAVYPEKEKLRITKYLIYCVQGNYTKTDHFSCALYKIQEKDQDILKKYTKQDIIAGALDIEKRAEPLVWLARDDLEEALMQGTICVTMPDNKERIFNVACNNGIAYDQKNKNKKEQKRYWSFTECDKLAGWGSTGNKIEIKPGVTFAGDVHSLGLGKIIALQYYDSQIGKNILRLGILADTGGAFEDNLYQLDLFTGIFPSRAVFNKKTKSIPDTASTYIMVKKNKKRLPLIKSLFN